MVGDDEAENGITEELQALVGGVPARLGAPGSMGYRLFEQRRIIESPTKSGLELDQRWCRPARRIPSGTPSCQGAPSLATT